MRHLSTLLAVLLTACVLTQAAWAQTGTDRSHSSEADPVEVPFELVRSRVRVPVMVNGHGPLNFMLDMGASGMGRLDDSVATVLDIPVIGQAENFDGVNTSIIDVVSVKRLTVGPLTQRNVELLSRDYPEVDGIIGRNFFENKLLTIDYPNHEIRWTEGTLDANASHVAGYNTAFRIPIRLGHFKATGSLDTGSSLTMHLPMAYADSLETTELVEAGVGRRANTTFKLFGATILEPVTIAGNTLTNLEVLFSEKATYVNIGSALLQRFAVTFDQQTQRIRIAPSSAQTAADSTAIRQTALDYIEGWYTGNAERMEEALHPKLAKRIVRKDPETGMSVLGEQNASTLIEATRKGYGTRVPEEQRLKEVTILDIFEGAASVKIVAAHWIDYLHMTKWNGEWKIVNVLWELKPSAAM